jgi:integrase
MPKLIPPLTDTQIKNAKPKAKDDKLRDGGGLYLLVKINGSKIWQFDYTRPSGGSNTISFGAYPLVTLVIARKKRVEIKSKLKQGIDPSEERKEAKQSIELQKQNELQLLENQFHSVTYKWLNTLKNDESTHAKRVRAFERDIFPYFCQYDTSHNITSSILMSDITHQKLLKVLKEKEATGAVETAIRLFKDCKRLFLWAVRKDYIEKNITDKIDDSDFDTPKVKHYAKITDEKILGELLRAIDGYKGAMVTRLALKLIPFLPLRAENFCTLKWDSVDFEKALITIPRQEMKVKDANLPDFKIPLSKQAVEILQEAKQLTGWTQWVFHGIAKFEVHLGLETINKALRTMGFNDELNGRKQRTHSFRGTFRSLADTHSDKHNAPIEVRKAVIDHWTSNMAERAYTHGADYSEQMRPLLQWWADFLDEIRAK